MGETTTSLPSFVIGVPHSPSLRKGALLRTFVSVAPRLFPAPAWLPMKDHVESAA